MFEVKAVYGFIQHTWNKFLKVVLWSTFLLQTDIFLHDCIFDCKELISLSLKSLTGKCSSVVLFLLPLQDPDNALCGRLVEKHCIWELLDAFRVFATVLAVTSRKVHVLHVVCTRCGCQRSKWRFLRVKRACFDKTPNNVSQMWIPVS